jgi:hypothetical protein
MGCPGGTVAGPVFVTAKSTGAVGVPPGLTVVATEATLLLGFGSRVVLVMMGVLMSTSPAGV